MTTNIEVVQNINSLTLKELSIEAAQLWEQIEQLDSGEGDVEQIRQQLFEVQGVQERKIDAVAYVADHRVFNERTERCSTTFVSVG